MAWPWSLFMSLWLESLNKSSDAASSSTVVIPAASTPRNERELAEHFVRLYNLGIPLPPRPPSLEDEGEFD